MSFFGSVVDAVSSFGGSLLGQYHNKKNMRDQASLQYDYAERYAKNSPTWNVQGLRDAGLNPMLAVSNGVNFGANIPNITNTSPNSKIGTKFTEALGRASDRAVNQQNADSQTLAAEAATKQAEAALLKARTDSSESVSRIAKTMADADLLKQDFERNKSNAGWRSDIVQDLNRFLDKSIDFFENSLENQRPEDFKSYLEHGPKRYKDGYDGLKFSEPTKEEKERWNKRPSRNRYRTIPLSPLPYQSAL